MLLGLPLLSGLLSTLAGLAVGRPTNSPSSNSRATLPFAARRLITRINFGSIVESDRARISRFKELGKSVTGAQEGRRRAVFSVPITNAALNYVASVGVGSPPTYYDLLLDTGSSNTFVGAGKPYVKTSTSVNTHRRVSVSYGSGDFMGTEYLDAVTLSSDLVVSNQSIGIALESDGFEGVDGILGLGPVDLTRDTVDSTKTVPTISDNLYSQGTTSVNAVGLFFAPTSSESNTNGELTFGGADPDKYTGKLNYHPLTNSYPASEMWGLDLSVSYNGNTILDKTAGIIDAGTTLLLLATDAYDKYRQATGATLDSDTDLLRLPASQYSSLSTLTLQVGSDTLVLTPNAQLFPRSLNADIGGTSDYVYLIVNDLGTAGEEGFQYVAGYAFIERFYTVFDTTNCRIGFATTAYTNATSN